MKTRMSILKTVVVGVMAIALGGAALGADTAANTAGSDSQEGMTAAGHAATHADLPAAAASVIAALVGGTNPSTTVAQNGTNEHATNQTTDNEVADNETETGNDLDIEAGHGLGPTGTSGTRPGWGCGDTNHTHSGPPGNPSASSPCGKH